MKSIECLFCGGGTEYEEYDLVNQLGHNAADFYKLACQTAGCKLEYYV